MTLSDISPGESSSALERASEPASAREETIGDDSSPGRLAITLSR